MRRVLTTVLVGLMQAASWAQEPVLADLDASQVELPVSVNLEEAQRWVERVLSGLGPQRQSGKQCARGELRDILGNVACVDVEIDAEVVPGSVRLNALKDGITISAAMDISGSAGRSTLNLSADGRLHLHGTLRPKVKPDWSLDPNLQLTHHWPNKPELKIHGVHLGTITSLADKAVDKAKNQAIAKLRDELNKTSGIRGLAEEAWHALAQPHRVAEGVWLLLRPTGMGMGSFVGNERTVLLPLTVQARPVISLTQPPDSRAPPLPPPVEPTSNAGTRIALTVEASFEDVEQRLRALVPSQRLEVPFAGTNAPVSVTDWKVRSLDGALRVGAEVTPSMVEAMPFKAWLWLSAKPSFDESSQELRLDEITVDAETDAVLAPLALLLADEVANGVRVNVAEKLSGLIRRLPEPTELSIPLGRGGRESTRLRIGNLSPRVVGVDVGSNKLAVVLSLEASVSGELTFNLPFVAGPPPIRPERRNEDPPIIGPPPVQPSGRYARTPMNRAPPNIPP